MSSLFFKASHYIYGDLRFIKIFIFQLTGRVLTFWNLNENIDHVILLNMIWNFLKYVLTLFSSVTVILQANLTNLTSVGFYFMVLRISFHCKAMILCWINFIWVQHWSAFQDHMCCWCVIINFIFKKNIILYQYMFFRTLSFIH